MKVLTTCPFCGCGCGVFLEVENERVLGVAPERIHPSSRGTLCPKGWNGFQMIHHSSRLTTPLIKKEGNFQKASWDEAVNLVVERLAAARAHYGPDSIGIVGSPKITNEANYLLARLARGILQTNNLDTSARFYQAPTMHALLPIFGEGAATAAITDFATADVIVLIGSNAKNQNAKVGSYIIRAVHDGKKLIVIDPHENDLSHFATVVIKLKPGTDLVMLNALISQVLKLGVEKIGKGLFSVAESLPKFTMEYANETTGVTPAILEQAAAILASSSNTIVAYSTGLTQQANGTDNVRGVGNLVNVIRSMGKRVGFIPLMPTNNMQGVLDLGVLPEFLPGHKFIDDEKTGASLATFWKCTLPKNKGFTLGEMIAHAGDSIKTMYVVGENLVWSAPDTHNTVKKLTTLDFLVVQELFLTETAELADVVLPAASFAEVDGTYTSTERRIQRVRKAIKPSGDAKSDVEIIATICNKIGDNSVPVEPATLFDEITQIVPMYQGATFEKLDVPGGLLSKQNLNGKINFAKISIKEPGEVPDDDFPFTLVIGRSYFHRMTGTMTCYSFTLSKEFFQGIVEIHPEDANKLKLRSGWKVKVITRRGEIVRTIQVTKNVQPKTLFVPIHQAEGHTNILANAGLETESKIPEMKICAAKLESLT